MDNDKKAVLNALELNKGIVTAACQSVDMARSTFYHWLNTDTEFKAAVDEIQEVALDYVESKLFEKIDGVWIKTAETEDGEPIVYKVPPSDTAIIFYLKTKGKRRGYIERMALTDPDGNALPPAQTGIFIGVDYSKLPANVLDTIIAAKIENSQG